jgi:hypothetical protein
MPSSLISERVVAGMKAAEARGLDQGGVDQGAGLQDQAVAVELPGHFGNSVSASPASASAARKRTNVVSSSVISSSENPHVSGGEKLPHGSGRFVWLRRRKIPSPVYLPADLNGRKGEDEASGAVCTGTACVPC